MKTKSVFLVLSFLILSTLMASPAMAQQRLQQPSSDDGRKATWTITVDPLTTALGFAHIQIERRLSSNWSVYSGPNMRLFDSLLSNSVEPYHGYGAEVGVRWFPLGGAPEGLWLVGRGVGARMVTLDPEEPLRGWGGYGSGLIGYTWLPFGWLALSGGAGVQYLRYGIDGFGTEGILPALHTAVGIAF